MGSPNGNSMWCSLVLEDPGATDNQITHQFASILQLPSKTITLSLRVLGHCQKPRPSKAYTLFIFYMYRRQHVIQAAGVDTLPTINHRPGTGDLIKTFCTQAAPQGKLSSVHTEMYRVC